MLPESSQSKASEAEVVAVGPGSVTKDGSVIPVSVVRSDSFYYVPTLLLINLFILSYCSYPLIQSVGDKVLLPEYGGLKIKLDGEDVYLFRNDEILAKFSS